MDDSTDDAVSQARPWNHGQGRQTTSQIQGPSDSYAPQSRAARTDDDILRGLGFSTPSACLATPESSQGTQQRVKQTPARWSGYPSTKSTATRFHRPSLCRLGPASPSAAENLSELFALDQSSQQQQQQQQQRSLHLVYEEQKQGSQRNSPNGLGQAASRVGGQPDPVKVHQQQQHQQQRQPLAAADGLHGANNSWASGNTHQGGWLQQQQQQQLPAQEQWQAEPQLHKQFDGLPVPEPEHLQVKQSQPLPHHYKQHMSKGLLGGVERPWEQQLQKQHQQQQQHHHQQQQQHRVELLYGLGAQQPQKRQQQPGQHFTDAQQQHQRQQQQQEHQQHAQQDIVNAGKQQQQMHVVPQTSMPRTGQYGWARQQESTQDGGACRNPQQYQSQQQQQHPSLQPFSDQQNQQEEAERQGWQMPGAQGVQGADQLGEPSCKSGAANQQQQQHGYHQQYHQQQQQEECYRDLAGQPPALPSAAAAAAAGCVSSRGSTPAGGIAQEEAWQVFQPSWSKPPAAAKSQQQQHQQQQQESQANVGVTASAAGASARWRPLPQLAALAGTRGGAGGVTAAATAAVDAGGEGGGGGGGPAKKRQRKGEGAGAGGRAGQGKQGYGSNVSYELVPNDAAELGKATPAKLKQATIMGTLQRAASAAGCIGGKDGVEGGGPVQDKYACMEWNESDDDEDAASQLPLAVRMAGMRKPCGGGGAGNAAAAAGGDGGGGNAAAGGGGGCGGYAAAGGVGLGAALDDSGCGYGRMEGGGADEGEGGQEEDFLTTGTRPCRTSGDMRNMQGDDVCISAGTEFADPGGVAVAAAAGCYGGGTGIGAAGGQDQQAGGRLSAKERMKLQRRRLKQQLITVAAGGKGAAGGASRKAAPSAAAGTGAGAVKGKPKGARKGEQIPLPAAAGAAAARFQVTAGTGSMESGVTGYLEGSSVPAVGHRAVGFQANPGRGGGSGGRGGGSGRGRVTQQEQQQPEVAKDAAGSDGAAKGSGKAKRLSKSASKKIQQQQLEEAMLLEQLVLDKPAFCNEYGVVRVLGETGAWEELVMQLGRCRGCCLGLLVAEHYGSTAVQYCSSAEGLTKKQQGLLKKAAAKVAAAGAEGGSGEGGSAAGGIGIMPIGSGESHAAAAAAAGVVGGAVGSREVVATTATMFFLPLAHPGMSPSMQAAAANAAAAAAAGFGTLEATPAAASSNASSHRSTPWQLTASSSQLINQVLLGGSGGGGGATPCICCNAKGVLVTLQQHGWVVPAADELQLVDPCVLGWVLDSQRVQDSKEADCYGLMQELAKQGMVRGGGGGEGRGGGRGWRWVRVWFGWVRGCG